MNYTIEIIDAFGRRRAWFHEVPLLEAIRRTPDQKSEIRGLFPKGTAELGPGCTVRVLVDDQLFLSAEVTRTKPQWGDRAKLILDKLVPFHETLEFEATTDPDRLNRRVSRAYTNREISAMLRDVLQAATGPIHYWVDHSYYPEGAEREYAKFLARKTAENELEVGGITEGQWVGPDRIDTTTAYAKDGDTIAGLVVDGELWPDIRFLMIDCEETSRNEHALKRHPETAFWTDAEYDASGYKRKGDAAKDALQALIDTHGIDYLELNPHRAVTGEYDDRVDHYGRYVALVYGGGQCFNAALVEHGLADVYLYEDGKFHDPEMALKDYFSYTAPHEDSVVNVGQILQEYDVAAGALEVLTALAYAANGYVFDIDVEHGVSFRRADTPTHVLYYDPLRMAVQFGRDATDLGNVLYFTGNPFLGAVEKTYTRGESIDEYGLHARRLEYFSITKPADGDRLAAGLLDDYAYPSATGEVIFYPTSGDTGESGGGAGGPAPVGSPGGTGGPAPVYNVGDLLELRGAPLRRLERELPGEYGGRYPGKLVARITEITHRFAGARVETRLRLGPPLRSVNQPLSYLVRSQPGATTLFEFRLDDPTAGLDLGFHLD